MSRARVLWCTLLLPLVGVVGIGVAATPAAAVLRHDPMVWTFGAASFHGSVDAYPLSRPIAAMATTANGNGYWLVGEDGAVYAFNAPNYGGIKGWPLPQPVVGITATPTGHGYWIVTADGAVFPVGDAHHYHDMHLRPLNAPIRALIPGPGGKGYYLYAADGGVFSFGSARFYGSTGNKRLNAPIVSMASTPNGKGYWLVAKDGGIFTFGNARFRGSMGGKHLAAPIVGMARTGTGNGYWLAGSDGGVFTFGDAQFKGSAAGRLPSDRQVVQLNGMPKGNGYRMLALKTLPDVPYSAPGQSGFAVSYLQYRLLGQGYWLPGVNGTFDSLTQQAVWAFQKANGLARTGVVDGATVLAFRNAARPHGRSTSGYVVEIDKTRQIMMLTTNGYANWTFNISSGSDHPYSENGTSGNAHTPEGVFSVVRQVNGSDKSPLGQLWRPKYFTWQGHAVHGYTSVPPYPASHGCVRVSNTAMNWIWDSNSMPMGTTVWVYL
jgi:peptidoglycan hydrolase-like protein with peptidoglycan-binding domain